MPNKIELMAPAGSLANLKAAVANGADSVYFGMPKFGARAYASNFNEQYLSELIKICKSNNVKTYLTMNTLIKNSEIKSFFQQLEFAYLQGIDAVIIQDPSFMDIIKKSFPGLKVHISTQAGVLNSLHANFLAGADRLNLARELTKEEIKTIRKNCPVELEMFVHGALCVSLSGSCLFSSFIGGRSGNRGRCAQPCRRKYASSSASDNSAAFDYFLSTKDLCLVHKIPEIIKLGINTLKIEGRMRSPYYVAATTSIYRKAIDSYYADNFKVTAEMTNKLASAFNREFTEGWYAGAPVFNRKNSAGTETSTGEFYKVKTDKINLPKRTAKLVLPQIKIQNSAGKRLLVRAYSVEDALKAAKAGADLIYFDLFDADFVSLKEQLQKQYGKQIPLYGITPRIFLDADQEKLLTSIKEKKPDGLLVGNLGILHLLYLITSPLSLPVHFDYNLNCFNDINLQYLSTKGFPIISPELSYKELAEFKNKNFAVLVHGKIRLMTLRHQLEKKIIKDEKGFAFKINKIFNGTEILNDKELGMFSKSRELLKQGLNNFYIDTDKNVGQIVRMYRDLLDNKPIEDKKIKSKYVLGWFFKGVE
ncbi:MAG: U32 family peptidase [Nanoarchaeota archaeon]